MAVDDTISCDDTLLLTQFFLFVFFLSIFVQMDIVHSLKPAKLHIYIK